MAGVYSIAEVVDDSNKRPNKTVFTILKDYDNDIINEMIFKSLKAVAKMIEKNGGKVFDSLQDTADYLNIGEVK